MMRRTMFMAVPVAILMVADHRDADFIDCGGGTGDQAFADPIDVVTGCEKVFVQA